MTIKKTLEELNAARWEDLTPEERRYRGHIAFEESRRAAKEYAARNGGPAKESAYKYVLKARDYQDRRRMEISGTIPVDDDAAWEGVLERRRQRMEEADLRIQRERAERERAEAEREAAERRNGDVA